MSPAWRQCILPVPSRKSTSTSSQSCCPSCILDMSRPSAPYRDSSDLPRPPPSYEAAPAASSSSEPLLGEDRGRHSEDDIPDDFKYIAPVAVLTSDTV